MVQRERKKKREFIRPHVLAFLGRKGGMIVLVFAAARVLSGH